jgi:hypothetical protein
MVVRLCVMLIQEIYNLPSQPFGGRTQLGALGIVRYHVNADQEYKRRARCIHSLSLVVHG